MLTLEAPFNSLSFGNIAFGITNELCKLNIKTDIFPIGGNVDCCAFSIASCGDYENWLRSGVVGALANYSKNNPVLKIWHINGSCFQVNGKQSLLTFHELDSLTETEVNILNQQEQIFVTSSFSKQIFETYGVKAPVHHVKLGFDAVHYFPVKKKPFSEECIVLGLFGKFEKRKHTEKTIKCLIKRFANDRKFRVHLHVQNPFFKPEEMEAIYKHIFKDGKPFNFEVFGFQPTNTLMNECYNMTDVVIDMSGGESISLPSLTCIGLGKHAVVHNCSAMKDWVNSENAVLVEPNGKEPVYDGKFFAQGAPFNQGNIFTWDENDFMSAIDKVLQRFAVNPINEKGFVLKEVYSFKSGIGSILDKLGIKKEA